MFIYNIITTVDTGSLEVLSYSSDKKVEYGQVVRVKVRNKEVLAINITQSDTLESQSRGQLPTFEVKAILEILPLILPNSTLDLILKTHAFSWNKIASIVAAVLQPFSHLEKKLTQIANLDFDGLIDLSSSKESMSKEKTDTITNFSVFHEVDIVVRIMYLIRSSL